MYIDIGPITRYIVTLNWVFFAVLLAISSVMCLLGFRFGRDIEKEAERQQTFFQNASHELKTPLMAIQGYAEGIQAGVMDAGGAADVILEESDRMTELVEELLDISKIDMGRQRLTLSETDIRELLLLGQSHYVNDGHKNGMNTRLLGILLHIILHISTFNHSS